MWAWLYNLLERFEDHDEDEDRIEYGECSGYGTYVDLDERKFPMANEVDSQSHRTPTIGMYGRL
jgi:hypothetical protein